MPVDSEIETPWAEVKRLQGEGVSTDDIATALTKRGLSRDDIELLLPELPKAEQTKFVPTPDSTTGSNLYLWVVIVTAMMIGTVAFMVSGSAGWISKLIAGGSLALVAALGAVQLRNARKRAALALGAIAGIFALPLFIGALVNVSGLGTGLAVVFFFGGIGLATWGLRAKEVLPGVPDFVKHDVFESNDVQFAVTSPDNPELVVGEPAYVRIWAHNCVDVKRTLRVRLSGSVEHLASAHEFFVELEPGQVVEARVPLQLAVSAPAELRLVLGISGRGVEGGRRVRVEEGGPWVTPAESTLTNVVGAITLVALGGGMFRLGSNGAFALKRSGAPPQKREVETVKIEVLSRPNAEQLERARRW